MFQGIRYHMHTVCLSHCILFLIILKSKSAISKLTLVLTTWKFTSLLFLLFVPYSQPAFFLVKMDSYFNPLLNGHLPYNEFIYSSRFSSPYFFILLAPYTVQFWVTNILHPFFFFFCHLQLTENKAGEENRQREKISFNTHEADWRHSVGYGANEPMSECISFVCYILSKGHWQNQICKI